VIGLAFSHLSQVSLRMVTMVHQVRLAATLGFRRAPARPWGTDYSLATLKATTARLGEMDSFRRALTQLGVLAAHPAAFLIVATYGVFWFVFDRESMGWHGLASLIYA
jgi:hypothetical protein